MNTDKNTARPRGTDSAKIIQVIQTTAKIGNGTKENPNRIVTELWTLEGELIASIDPEFKYA